MPGLDPAGGSLDKQCAADTQGSLYSAPITTVQRTGATTVIYTVSGTNSFRINDRVLAFGTSVDSGSFNTPKSGAAYIVNELVTAVGAQTVTVTQSTSRGTNPTGPSADTGTLQKSAIYTWKDPSTLRWWGCTQFGNVTNFNLSLQEDPGPMATGTSTYNNISSWTSVKSDKFGTNSPYTDSNLNYCHDSRLRLQALGFNGWGEYTNSNCRPTTINAAYGGNNLAPVAERMPFTFQIQTSLSVIEDISNLAHLSCGLTRCPVKSDWTNVRQSYWGAVTSGTQVDAFDPVYTDITNGWLPQFVANDASAKAIWNNDNHDYLIAIVYEESDTVPGGKASGEAVQAIGNGSLTGPATGNPGTANWSSGGLVIASGASNYNLMIFHTGLKLLTGQYHVSAQLCGNLRSGGSSCTNAGAQNQVYPDTIFHTKDAYASWLQGTRDVINAVPCARTAGVITCTLGAANVGPSTAPPYYNVGDVLNITACSDSTFNTVAGTGTKVTAINAAAGTVTATLAGAGSSATGCTVGAGPGYTSIASLVTAWGLTAGAYDTFGTDETRVTGETLFTGTGIAGPYTGNLSGSPSTYTPGSLQIFVGGVLTCADRGDAYKATSPTTTNHLTCNTNVNQGNINGTIDTAAGAYSITFDSVTSAAVTANYSKAGWGSGKGLLDEAGQNLACVADKYALVGGTCGAAMKTDLDNFHYYYTKSFHATAYAVLSTQFPGVMRIATDPIGGYSVSADSFGLLAIAEHTNILCPPTLPNFDPQGITTDSATRVAVFSQFASLDKPYLNFLDWTHVSDGYQGGNATVGNKWSTDSVFTGVIQSGPDFVDGKHGADYYGNTYIPAMLNQQVTCGGICTGTFPFIGVAYLQGDHLRLGSLWSPYWDLYDGKESQPNAFTNTRGYQGGCVGTFGCNPNTSTDAVTGVKFGNLQWLNNVSRTHTTGTMGGTNK